MKKLRSYRRIYTLVFLLPFGYILFKGYFIQGNAGPSRLFDEVFSRGFIETGAENLVAAVYLNYRLFDTLLEALLLLVSVIGIAQFARLATVEKKHKNSIHRKFPRKDTSSRIMIGSLAPVYLLIALFGSYIIITGMDGPGGGFQGGAILAAIVISAHFAEGRHLISIQIATILEKSMYVCILAVGAFFLLNSLDWDYTQHRIYLLLMNILIGVKVFSGLSLIYLHFMSLGTEEEHGI